MSADGDEDDQPFGTAGSDESRPDESDESRPDGSDGLGSDESGDPGTTAGLERTVTDADGGFDWRGWLLVAVVAVAFLVIPGVILLRPVRVVGFRTTYLLLPLLPAFVLGATAVWVAVRSRGEER